MLLFVDTGMAENQPRCNLCTGCCMNKQYGKCDDWLKDQRRLEILCPERCKRAKAHTHAYAGYRAETNLTGTSGLAQIKTAMDGRCSFLWEFIYGLWKIYASKPVARDSFGIYLLSQHMKIDQ